MSKLFFNHVSAAPPDPILDFILAFNQDPRPEKINLTVGFFRNEELLTPILDSVKEAERIVIEKEKNKEYMPIDGDRNFVAKMGALIFGEFFWVSESKRIHGAQTPGGTGALRIGGDFFKQEVGERIAISDPTWPTHRGIYTRCGLKVETYPYYDFQRQLLDFDRCLQFLKGLAPGTAVLLQVCCHNPTGIDFSMEQWLVLSKVFKENGLFPFFDIAYQGFGKSLEEDAAPVRLFAKEGHEMIVAASTAKNFGLYGERVGALFTVTESEAVAQRVGSKIRTIIRMTYSNPPIHGAKIVLEILSNEKLRTIWEEEVKAMCRRIGEMRRLFVDMLVDRSLKRDFRFLYGRTGMFSFIGIDQSQVEQLRREFAIFMTLDGRINVSGLNKKNVGRVVDAIVEVTQV